MLDDMKLDELMHCLESARKKGISFTNYDWERGYLLCLDEEEIDFEKDIWGFRNFSDPSEPVWWDKYEKKILLFISHNPDLVYCIKRVVRNLDLRSIAGKEARLFDEEILDLIEAYYKALVDADKYKRYPWFSIIAHKNRWRSYGTYGYVESMVTIECLELEKQLLQLLVKQKANGIDKDGIHNLIEGSDIKHVWMRKMLETLDPMDVESLPLDMIISHIDIYIRNLRDEIEECRNHKDEVKDACEFMEGKITDCAMEIKKNVESALLEHIRKIELRKETFFEEHFSRVRNTDGDISFERIAIAFNIARQKIREGKKIFLVTEGKQPII